MLKYCFTFLVLLYALEYGTGLYFRITETEQKCFMEKIPDMTSVLANYKVGLYDPRTDGFKPSKSRMGIHMEVYDPDDKMRLSRIYSSEERISFTFQMRDVHIICLYSNSSAWFRQLVLEEEALKGKDSMQILKRKADDNRENNNEDDGSLPNKLEFRSYKPQNESLKKNVLEDAKPGNVEERIQDQLNAANKIVVTEELDISDLAPGKANWDLKRDLAIKLEKLEKRTQKAIAELLRECLEQDYTYSPSDRFVSTWMVIDCQNYIPTFFIVLVLVTRMAGRKSKVPSDMAVALIEKHICHFITNDFPPSGHPVWKDMSKDVDGKWTPGTVYNHVRENRRGDLTKARHNQNISICPPELRRVLIEDDVEDDVDDGDELYISDVDEEYEPKIIANEAQLHVFDLLLLKNEWEEIKPDNTSDKPKATLKKYKWASVITNAFSKRYKFSCAFSAKSSYVVTNFNPKENDYFLKFRAYCKDKTDCKNVMLGTARTPPTEEGLRLLIKTVDTRKFYHSPVTRNLVGAERDEVKKKLLKQSAANYRDEQLRSEMNFGEDVPANIRSNHIYRQVRMEGNKEKVGLKPKEKVDVFKSIQAMSTSVLYDGVIHDLGGIRFYVIYSTLDQMFAYLEYVRLEKENSKIAIDATGKIVKSFELCPGKKTGHVFIYTVTINYKNKTYCVYQMITENHTQEFIEYWLKLWVRLGALSPAEAVSDYARAIPMSCCLTFNNMSLKAYVDTCFSWAVSETRKLQRPVNTLIRIDVAHLMHLASCWKSIKNEKHPAIKKLRLYCVALMVDSKTVKRFSRIFLLTNIISLHPYFDTIINIDGISMLVSTALTELQNAISEKQEVINSFEESMSSCEENKKYNATDKFQEGESGTLTHQFVKKLINQARPSSSNVIGTQINPFYREEFSNDLERLGKEFPLWTGIMRPDSDQHASSAHQEGYFAYLRNTIFESISLPCSADRFVSEHIQSTKSGTNVLAAELKHTNHRRKCCSSPSQEIQREHNPLHHDFRPLQPPLKKIHMFDDSDLKACEPWRGLKNENPIHVANESLSEDASPTAQEKFCTNTFPVEESEHDIKVEEITVSYDGKILMTDAALMIENAVNDNSMEKQYYECQEKSNSSTVQLKFNSSVRHFNETMFDIKFTSTPLIEHSYAQYALFDNRDLLKDTEYTCPKSQGDKQELLDDEIQIIDNMENIPNNQQNMIGVNDWAHGNEKNVHVDCQSNKKKKIVNMENKEIPKPKGFYFQPNREIKLAINRPATKKGLLLPNGSKLKKLITIKRADNYPWIFEKQEQLARNREIKVRLLNTCGFDSIIHILQFSAIDYDDYKDFVDKSSNMTLKFIKQFMENGVTAEILMERLKLINKFHPIKGERFLNPYYVNAENSILTIWNHLFEDEPSAFETHVCTNHTCPRKNATLKHLSVNQNIIKTKGYGALRQALLYHHSHDVKCRQLFCPGIVKRTTTLNKQICIELDVQQNENRSLTKECRLKDLPLTLDLEQTFQLVGVVHHNPNMHHFTAYCLRASGLWVLCDDMKTSIQYKCKETTIVKPHIIIYVRT